jgi:hypothetical protein
MDKKMETTMAERMATLETDVKYIRERLDRFIENADKRYASKLTEKIVYGLVGVILLAFMSKLLGVW